ncbi:hypothetical protein [Modestobacter sp. I12A-02662]|uniref:hypothetical protein n=1 Tax=Modestobacter sp. I12A-02662 TaxID=1730496 RepID=UPI0034E000D1
MPLSIFILVALVGVFVGMWKLPALFVDEASLVKFNGDRDGEAIQTAYNAARVPIGVVLASLLAAAAAGAGVITTRRSIAVTQAGVELNRMTLESAEARHQLDREDARAKDERDRLQWRQEQLPQRFQDASAQLGSTRAAVRLAGVYALARLADDWEEQRQVCIDVLCSYLRIVGQDDDGGEDQVRAAIQVVLKRGLEPNESGLSGWPDMRLDLSKTELRDFELTGFSVHWISLVGAAVIGRCALAGESRVPADLDGMHVKGTLQLSGLGLLGANMRNITYEESDGRYSIWEFEPRPRTGTGVSLEKYRLHDMRGFRLLSGNLQLDAGGYRDFPRRGRIELYDAFIAPGTTLSVSGRLPRDDERSVDEVIASVCTANADIQGKLKLDRGLAHVPSH